MILRERLREPFGLWACRAAHPSSDSPPLPPRAFTPGLNFASATFIRRPANTPRTFSAPLLGTVTSERPAGTGPLQPLRQRSEAKRRVSDGNDSLFADIRPGEGSHNASASCAVELRLRQRGPRAVDGGRGEDTGQELILNHCESKREIVWLKPRPTRYPGALPRLRPAIYPTPSNSPSPSRGPHLPINPLPTSQPRSPTSCSPTSTSSSTPRTWGASSPRATHARTGSPSCPHAPRGRCYSPQPGGFYTPTSSSKRSISRAHLTSSQPSRTGPISLRSCVGSPLGGCPRRADRCA